MNSGSNLVESMNRHLKSGSTEELFSEINRLKFFDSQAWHETCSDSKPLIEIKDSVLKSVNVILNLNLEIQEIIEGKISPEQFFQNYQEIKAKFDSLGTSFRKAAVWMKSTQQDRWLHQLLKSTEDSDEEREKLVSLIAKSSMENRIKKMKIEDMKAEIKSLRLKSRQRIEERWTNRHSSEKRLNDNQKQASEILEGRLVIKAGPGSGKTHVLVERIANLIRGGANPSRILMLTFTVKATAEMSTRVERKIGNEVSEIPVIMNFNSYCKHMVESDYEGFGFEKIPLHIDPRLRRYFFDDLLNEDIDDGLKEVIEQNPEIIEITMRIDDLLHNRSGNVELITNWFREEVLRPLEEFEEESIAAGESPSKDLVLKRLTYDGLRLVNPLRNFIRQKNGLTFGDQISLFHARLKDDPGYLAKVCSEFDHVLVDEFQDNNKAQAEIIKLFSEHLKSTCVVGDPNQAIYGFRGANVTNLQEFMSDFEQTEDLKNVDLDTCYRHSQNVVDYSEKLIAKNSDISERPNIKSGWINDDSTKVSLQCMIDEASEAVEHANEIEMKHLLGYEFDEMAILCRSLDYASNIVSVFEDRSIPYVSTSSSNLFREEITIKAGMILRSCIDPVGNPQAIDFLLKIGFMGVTKEDAEILSRNSKYNPQGLFDSLSELAGNFRNERTIVAFRQFIDSNKKLPTHSMEEWLFSTLKESGLINEMIALPASSDLSKLISLLLEQLANAGDFFTDASRFSRYVKQLMEGKIELEIEQVSKPGHVVVSTIHKAKGLEWPIVVMPSLDDRNIPGAKTPEKAEKLIVEGFFGEDIDEERKKELLRIFYVGLTRVQDLIRLSRPLTRTEKSKPNDLFLLGSNIFPVEHIETIHPSILQRPLTPKQDLMIKLRSKLDDSIVELRHGKETEDLSKSVRSLLIYHLEQLVQSEHGIDPSLKSLVREFEAIVGRVDYEEFIEQEDNLISANLWMPERYTWSMLNSYRDCPQKFAFSYVHKLVGDQTKSLTIGNLVHEIVEEVSKLGKEPTDSEFNEILNKSIENHRNTLPLIDEQTVNKIIEMVNIWKSSERSKNKIIAVEKGIEFKFYDRNFYGKIDRVELDSEERLRIIDYKTGKANNIPGNSGQEQLLLYAYGWKQVTGDKPEVIAYDYIMQDKVESREISEVKLERGLSKLIPVIEGIEMNDFLANPRKDYKCQYCNYSGLCPDMR